MQRHKEQCRKMFKHITDEKEIYVRLDSHLPDNFQRYENEEMYIRLSVITEEMLDYDREYLSGNLSPEDLTQRYRPYFASFLIT